LNDAAIILQRDENIALLLISNPRLRNALSTTLLLQLRARLDELCRDDGIGALMIGSAVEGFFASGGNIGELRALEGSKGGLQFAQLAQATFKMVEQFPRPVVAAINGFCLGAGVELAVSADVRIAADNAVIASPQVGLGILPGLGGGQRLIRLCGVGRARHQILSGDRINAEEALRLRLVELVVPASDLRRTAVDMAKRLACKPRVAAGLAKQALNRSSQARLKGGCAYEASLFGLACSATKECRLRTVPHHSEPCGSGDPPAHAGNGDILYPSGAVLPCA
jgi:enoyl-CoA hydratase